MVFAPSEVSHHSKEESCAHPAVDLATVVDIVEVSVTQVPPIPIQPMDNINNKNTNNISNNECVTNSSSLDGLPFNVNLTKDLNYLYSNDLRKRNEVIKHFVQTIVKSETFSFSKIKRAMNSYIYNTSNHNNNNNLNTNIQIDTDYDSGPLPCELTMLKPNGLDVKDMFYSNPSVFGSGSVKLPPGSHPLKSDKVLYYHQQCCEYCLSSPFNSDCYIHSLNRCLDYGWFPPVDTERITPLYSVNGNYKSVSLYSDSTGKEINDMISNGVLIPCNPTSTTVGLVTPLGAVVKNSDKLRARTLVGINITDQTTLSKASELLVQGGWNKVKVRITTDCAATGLNRARTSEFSF